jgi:hypothetical protein
VAIYLQEIAAIDRGGKEKYLELVRTRWAPFVERTRGAKLLWAGSTIGSTARWPETIVLYELADWDRYAAVCDRMYTDGTDDGELRSLWREALPLRLRSRSRSLVGAPFSPTLNQLRGQGVAGTAFVFTSWRLRAGRHGAFFRALEQRAAEDARRGRDLVGAYEVAFTKDEAYAIWSHRTLADLTAFEACRGKNDWGPAVERWSEHWGFTAPGTPLWPESYGTDVRVW